MVNICVWLCAGGYHPVRIGEKFKDGRYVVMQKLGWGHFSTVWLVQDTQTGAEAALKVSLVALHGANLLFEASS